MTSNKPRSANKRREAVKERTKAVRILASKKLADLPIHRIIPSVFTIVAVCSGLSAVRFAISGDWNLVVVYVVIAAVLDTLDGIVARMLKGASTFGAELDSLADVINFGVVPSVTLYIYTFQEWGKPGWIVCLFYTVCSMLRLARFNTMTIKQVRQEPWMKRFFIGVPAPSGACIVLLPLTFDLIMKDWGYTDFQLLTTVHALFLVMSAILQISRIPTFALKGQEIPVNKVPVILIGVVIFTGGLILEPWPTLFLLGMFYLGTLPLSYNSFRKLENQ